MDITSPGAGLPHLGNKCLQKNGLFHLPSHACTHLLLSSPTQHPWELLHTCHETPSRGKGPAPRVREAHCYSIPAAAQGLPGPSLIFMPSEKQLSAPRNLCHVHWSTRVIKMTELFLGKDSEKPHTAKDFWALLCGRGSTVQIQQTTPPLTILCPDFGRRGLSAL